MMWYSIRWYIPEICVGSLVSDIPWGGAMHSYPCARRHHVPYCKRIHDWNVGSLWYNYHFSEWFLALSVRTIHFLLPLVPPKVSVTKATRSTYRKPRGNATDSVLLPSKFSRDSHLDTIRRSYHI